MNVLRFPDPSITTRPDVPSADAYLIDDDLGSEVVGSDYFTLPFACDVDPGGSVTPLECLASFDHGLRTGDETSHVVGVEAAFLVGYPIMWTLISAANGGPAYPLAGDWSGCANRVLDLPGDWSGWLDDVDASQAVYEWSLEMVDLAGDAGYVVDQSGDAGMTWFYRPMSGPITRD